MRKPVDCQRIHVFWSGRVQGVGFRYTIESVAMDRKLSGWVMNLSDGRVEAVCEGPAEALDGFLTDVRSGPMKPYIQKAQVTREDPTKEFQGFEIRFY